MRNRIGSTALAVVFAVGCGGKADPTANNPYATKPQDGGGATSKWTDFQSSRYGFSMRFPYGQPTEGGPNIIVQTHFTQVRQYEQFSTTRWTNGEGVVNPKYSFSLVAVLYREPSKPADRTAIQEMLFRRLMSDWKGMKVGEPKSVTWAGKPAQETECVGTDPADPKQYKRFISRQLTDGDRSFFAVVRDGDGGLMPTDVSMFFDSLELQPVK